MAHPEMVFALRSEQRMLMLPRMLRALDVLRLPSDALSDYISSAISENEALVVRRRRRPAGGSRRTRDSFRTLELQPARTNLRDELKLQLADQQLDPRTRSLVDTIIESIAGNGLRGMDDADLAASIEPRATPVEIAMADQVVATLEPHGVGARSVVDAMIQQVSPQDPDRGYIQYILKHHLGLLSRHRHEDVARALDITIDDLHLLLKKIRKLQTRPAAGFDVEAVAHVRPEAVVRRENGVTHIEWVHAPERRFGLSEEMLEIATNRGLPPEVRSAARERIDAAKAVIACLTQRRATLERVVQSIFAKQVAFLEKGVGSLRPLAMQDLADSIGVHPSTVSRAVAGKYVETAHGILPLRQFFAAGVELEDGGCATRDSLRDAIREIFESEDPTAPLDDDTVVHKLRDRGYKLARRTVAKYRGELGIASSWHRHRMAPAAV